MAMPIDQIFAARLEATSKIDLPVGVHSSPCGAWMVCAFKQQGFASEKT
jgi:hypothetical protein